MSHSMSNKNPPLFTTSSGVSIGSGVSTSTIGSGSSMWSNPNVSGYWSRFDDDAMHKFEIDVNLRPLFLHKDHKKVHDLKYKNEIDDAMRSIVEMARDTLVDVLCEKNPELKAAYEKYVADCQEYVVLQKMEK